MQPGAFAADYDGSSQTLTVAGDVEEESALALRDAIDAHSASFTRPLVIDLTAVTYLPSVAVGVLAKAGQKATTAGQPLDLVAADGSIAQRVLTVCALPHRTS